MQRRILFTLVVFLACTPQIDNTPATPFTVARFDPAAAVPIVPTPNDLATDPKTGLLAVTPPANATGADLAFYEWLNTLDGFPAAATATASLTREVDPASVNASSVRVIDLDAVTTPVMVKPTASVVDSADAPGLISVAAPAGGWTAGHRYAVAVVSGTAGVKGRDGTAVAASPTWALLRVSKPLVTCEDLTSPTCAPTTEVIPSRITGDAAGRLADQTASALRLEVLRRKYAPVLDAFIAAGVARQDIALAWSFKIGSNPIFVFNPAGTPARVPTPTNLVLVNGKVNAPIDPTSSPANQEFTADYLNSLNGFPPTATAVANVAGPELDIASVSSAAFQVVPLAGGPLAEPPTFAWDSATKTISVKPAGGSWGRGRTIAIAALSGTPSGLKGVNGKALAASDAWALARSAASLVDCTDLASPDCKPAITAAPLTAAQAKGLEAVRRGYKPVLDGLVKAGLKRSNVVGLWVFSTVNQPELTFDLTSASPVVPFPNNQFLRSADDVSAVAKLTFPVDPALPTAALFGGLNTLNGFSTTAPLVSENAVDKAALDEGTIDAATLAAGTGFAKLEGAGPLMPKVKTCLNCASSTGGATAPPEQLQWVPERPLEQLTRYAAWVSTDLKDSTGRPVATPSTFALLRLKNPLLDEAMKSTVPVVSDAVAARLEPVRLKFKDCLDKIEATGVPRKKIAMGFCVTTQSTTSVVQQLSGAVGALPVGTITDSPTMLIDVTTPTKAVMTSLGIQSNAIGKIFAGVMLLPYGLSAGGVLSPPAMWTARKAPFTLFIPAACQGNNCSVTLFGHGLTRNRNDSLGIANALAQANQATFAIDVVQHGDRSNCAGFGKSPGQTSDDAMCADPATQTCDVTSGRCVARDQTPAAATVCDPQTTGDAVCFAAQKGFCQFAGPNAGKCEGGDYARNARGEVANSAWNFLDLINLFATRDNFRYTGSIDFAAVVRLLKSNAATSLSAQLAILNPSPLPTLNTNSINYVGQSLGTFNGSVFSASSPVANNVALNVAGSSQVDVLLTAPSFGDQRRGFLATLAAQRLTPGTPGFDQFITLARTIVDPADPQNLIYDAVNSSNANRKIYVQSIEGDEVLPNLTTDLLTQAAEQNPARTIQKFRFTVAGGSISAAYPTMARHGFLLSPAGNPDCNPVIATCATVVAQNKVATFLATGVAP